MALHASEPEEGSLYLHNGGLVLTSPFLPHFFQSLDMLVAAENGRSRFRDWERAARGVHLLQYLVDGETSAPEPLLALNKLLCGLPLAAAILPGIEVTDRERDLCGQLLRAMIANWSAIAQTSIAGLRETFLQREARLDRGSDGWHLTVQRRTVDVLVDQIPWSFSMLLLPWMPEIIRVTW